MKHSIIEFLNLDEEEVQSIQCESIEECLYVSVTLRTKDHTCPTCGTTVVKVKDYYQRKINHGLFINRKCIVLYKQRRYQCPVCNTSFNEVCPFATKHQKKSISSHLEIMELAKDPHTTFKKIAELLHMSPSTVMDEFYRNLPVHHPIFPKVMCIDEVYLGRNSVKKYIAILLDFETNQIVDIIYGRTKDSLHSYFQKVPVNQLKKVKYLSSDMYEGYLF